MSDVINEDMAMYFAELSKFLDSQFDKYKNTYMEHVFPGMQVQVKNEDGLIAKFWEEGIEFYPDEKED